MEGVGPQDLTLSSLITKIKQGNIKELIFALSSTMEGDTTNFYIYRQLEGLGIDTSTIARGVAVGDDQLDRCVGRHARVPCKTYPFLW